MNEQKTPLKKQTKLREYALLWEWKNKTKNFFEKNREFDIL